MNQKQTILKHMKRGRIITTVQATIRYGVCRLSERIRELEADGYRIQREPIQRGGKRFMSYRLAA